MDLSGLPVHFAHPVPATLLLALGLLGILFEARVPGIGPAGPAGALAFALFYVGHLQAELAGLPSGAVLGGGLVVVGWSFRGMREPGLLTGVGTLLVLAGATGAALGPEPGPLEMAKVGGLVVSALLLVLLASVLLWRRLPAAERPSQPALVLVSPGPHGETGGELLRGTVPPGEVGHAVTPLRPAGVGLFGGERVEVVCEGDWIEEGTPIRAVSTEGVRLLVEAVPTSPPSPSS